jgi:hypothetical protein
VFFKEKKNLKYGITKVTRVLSRTYEAHFLTAHTASPTDIVLLM